jgi:hypothetical protein
MKRPCEVLLILAFCVSLASATPTTVGSGAFSGSTVVVDFLAFSSGTLISNQLASTATHGLTFSSALGGIYANSDYSSFTGVAVSATSFQPSFCPCVDVTLSFSTPVQRVGFSLLGGNAGTLTLTDNNGSVTTSIAQFPTEQFVGVQDLSGISSLTVDAPVNQAFVTDTVWVDSPVPEPGTFVMLGTGLLGLASVLRRRFTA